MATITEARPAYTKLQLRTAYGPVFRDVSTRAPRPATAEEIPIIDFTNLYGDADARLKLSKEIKHAATTSGFFYAKNHGIEEAVIEKAKKQALAFFKQPAEAKLSISTAKSKYFNGYSASKTTHVSEGESLGKSTLDCQVAFIELRLRYCRKTAKRASHGATMRNTILIQRTCPPSQLKL